MKSRKLFSVKVRIVLLILCLVAGYCVVRLAMPKQQYVFEGGKSFQQEEAGTEYCVYEQIALPIGVYKVQLQYQTGADYSGMCTVKDGTVFHGGLLTNGEHLYQGLSQTDFMMWLYEGTEALQVYVSYSGNTYLDIGTLVIQDTGLLWSMLLTIIICAGGLLVGGCLLKEYVSKHPLDTETRNIVFGLSVIILLSSITFMYGFCVSGADLTYHLMRIEGVKDGIISGQFPIRIEPEWLNGHGYANAVCYCNALFLFPAILRLLGFTITTCYNMYGIALNIATTLISYYCFARIFKNRYIGLLCCGLYTLSIFRIFRLIAVTAIGEGSALTFLPLIVYGFYRALTENPKEKAYKTVWVPIALGYAGIIQTHVLTCEITAVLTVVVCLIFIKKICYLPTFLELAKGALAAVGLSCWYLVPFLDYFFTENLHIRHVSARTIQERGIELIQLLTPYGCFGKVADELRECNASVGWILLLGFVVWVILWFGCKLYKQRERIVSLGMFAWIFSGVLMVMSLRVFPWDAIQSINSVTASLVSSLQFPFRFLGWATALLVVVFGCCMWYAQQRKGKIIYHMGVAFILVGIFTSSLLLLNYVGKDYRPLYLYNEEGMGFGYISGGEYIVEGTDASVLSFADPVTSEGIILEHYEKEYNHVSMQCSNKSEDQGYIELPMLHYTGYRAYAGNGSQLDAVKGNNNVIRIRIPEGFSDSIEVKYVPPVYWRISEVISYISWGIVIVYGFRVLRRRNGLA